MKKMLQKTAAVLLSAATLCAGLPVISVAAVEESYIYYGFDRYDDSFEINDQFRYEADKKLLTIFGDVKLPDDNQYIVLESHVSGLTINIEGDVSIYRPSGTALYLYGDTVITGSGSLSMNTDAAVTVNGKREMQYNIPYGAIECQADLTLTLRNITYYGGVYGTPDANCALSVENSNVYAKRDNGASPFLRLKGGITLTDCAFVTPEEYAFDEEGTLLTPDGGMVEEIVISKIEKPLTIDTQPKAVSAAVGDTAKFTVAASGSGLSYQWQYYDGTWHNTSMTGAKTDTLTVPVIAARNGLKYRCVITDEFGKTVKSNAVKLTVLPTITEQPKAAAGVVGGTAKFTVAATGAGLTYQWQYYDGEWHDTTLTGAKTATLSVGIKAARNGLKYRCVITDANGKTLKTNAVKLMVNPKITTQPAAVSAAVGETAKFTIAASGAGLTYQWQYYDGTWHDTSMTGAKTATLSVPVIAGRNGLKYRCIVTDANGTVVKSNAVKLTVLPSITTQPKAVTAAVGDTAKFTVKATGAGLTYQWQYYNPKTDKWAETTLTGAKTATLSVGATTGRNGLSYRCIITDANGATLTSEAALLTVK